MIQSIFNQIIENKAPWRRWRYYLLVAGITMAAGIGLILYYQEAGKVADLALPLTFMIGGLLFGLVTAYMRKIPRKGTRLPFILIMSHIPVIVGGVLLTLLMIGQWMMYAIVPFYGVSLAFFAAMTYDRFLHLSHPPLIPLVIVGALSMAVPFVLLDALGLFMPNLDVEIPMFFLPFISWQLAVGYVFSMNIPEDVIPRDDLIPLIDEIGA